MKKLLFVQSKAPHGSINGQEGLDAILAGSAFTECDVLLIDDGVFQLLTDQVIDVTSGKDYSVTYGALADYGVDRIHVAASHLKARGFGESDLVVPVTALDDDGVRNLMASADVILSH